MSAIFWLVLCWLQMGIVHMLYQSMDILRGENSRKAPTQASVTSYNPPDNNTPRNHNKTQIITSHNKNQAEETNDERKVNA